MGGHGGLNILPQKSWNVYNFDNREKVKRDEEAAAKEEQLKREESLKRDSELRLEQLRRARGLDPSSSAPQSSATEEIQSTDVAGSSAVQAVPVEETEVPSESDSKHINLFHGIKIFDPIEAGIGGRAERRRKNGGDEKDEEVERKRKKMRKEAGPPRVVGPEDERYGFGYGVAGKGVKAPWYMMKSSSRFRNEEVDAEEGEEDRYSGGEGKMKKKKVKSLEELREERMKREKKEKERERALLMKGKVQKSHVGVYRDRYYQRR